MIPFAIGTGNKDTDPAIAIGNQKDNWTVLATDGAVAAAGISGNVLAIGGEPLSGAISGATSGQLPPVLALDNKGNLGLSGFIQIGGSEPAQMSAAYGAPPNSVEQLPYGSLYLRSDSLSSGPRLYQYQSLPSSDAKTDWLEIPLGLGIFNVKDYGAVGLGSGDDTSAIQLAINAAASYNVGQGSGALLYFPPGQYPIYTSTYLTTGSGPLTISGSNNLTVCGAGSVSQILAYADLDVFLASGTAPGLTIRDLQIQYVYVSGSGNPNFGLSGAAMHFIGGDGTFRIENVDTGNVGLGLYANNNKGGTGHITNCTLAGNVAGAYVNCGAEIHHCVLSGSTYGLISDESDGIKMTNVPLYGALCLATWNTTSGSGSMNTVYCYDVETNYSDPFENLARTTVTSGSFQLSGVGTTYPSIETITASGTLQAASVGWPIYIRDLTQNQVGGTVLGVTGSAFSMVSNLETPPFTSGMIVINPTIGSHASVWDPAPLYPSQVGGEGVGSASLAAAQAQVHLSDCSFPDGTVIGGTPPVTYTTLAAPFTLTGMPTGTYTIEVSGTRGFLTGAGIYVLAPVSGNPAYAFGDIDSFSGTTGITFTSSTEHSGATSGLVASGAFISQAFEMAGAPFFPAPPTSTNPYPFQPQNVTVGGGSWHLAAPSGYQPASPAASAAIDVAEGAVVAIGGCNISTDAGTRGYGIQLGVDVQSASIVGNNLATSGSSGAIAIGPSANVNCQGNLCQFAPASGAIAWPSGSSQPFIVARNPGFNPTGLFIVPPTGTAAAQPFSNSYGVPGAFYVKNGTGAITGISVFSTFTSAFNDTGLTSGAFHVEPGGEIQVGLSTTGTPTVHFVGD